MLTLKLITEQYDRVIAGLNKKHFEGAREAIDAVIAKDQERRQTQKTLDDNLAEANRLAKSIGMLMKNGQRAEAEAAKARVAELKAINKELDEKKAACEGQITDMLCQIPNIPYDEVPEGTGAEDNWVVKSNLKECVLGQDTVGNWTCNPEVPTAKLPHWELAKNLNLIDFDLGVDHGCRFPRLSWPGRSSPACPYQFLPHRSRQCRLRGDYASNSRQQGVGLRHRSAA